MRLQQSKLYSKVPIWRQYLTLTLNMGASALTSNILFESKRSSILSIDQWTFSKATKYFIPTRIAVQHCHKYTSYSLYADIMHFDLLTLHTKSTLTFESQQGTKAFKILGRSYRIIFFFVLFIRSLVYWLLVHIKASYTYDVNGSRPSNWKTSSMSMCVILYRFSISVSNYIENQNKIKLMSHT